MNKNPLLYCLKMENTFISTDKALEFVGDNLNYQKKILFLLSIQWTLFSFLTMGMPFLFAPPTFLCYEPKLEANSKFSNNNNFSIKNDSFFTNDELKFNQKINYTNFVECNEVEACKGEKIVIREEGEATITKDFELYCGGQFWIAFCQSLFFLAILMIIIGSAIGGFCFPLISDKKGRKFALLLSELISSITIILLGISLNIYMVLAFLFLAGFSLNGYETISYVYVNEISAERFRSFSIVILTSVWSFAQIIYTPISYSTGDWRITCIAVIGIPFLIIFFLSFNNIHETPRFLISKRKFEEAKIILNKISMYNRRPQFNYRLEGETENIELEDMDESKKENRYYSREKTINVPKNRSYNYLDLFKYASVRSTTFYMFFLWFFRYFCYYGLAFSLAALGGEMHLNFFYIAVAEFLACVASGPLKMRFKRVKTMFLCVIIFFISCFLIFLFGIPSECYASDQDCYQKISSRICITIYSSVLITYTGEIYPTVVRSVGFGLASSFGKIGNILMPFMVNTAQYYGLNPSSLFGFFGIILVVLIPRMKETFGYEMANYIKETLEEC